MSQVTNNNFSNSNPHLPQMKSIWIDEDQEAEKLYSLQAQQLLSSGSDEELNITMINSDKPKLPNKNKINLRPLLNTSNNQLNNGKYPKNLQSKTLNNKKSFLNLFRSNSDSLKKNRSISAPFDFHHISHAGGKADSDNESIDIPSTKLRIVNQTPLIDDPKSTEVDDAKPNVNDEVDSSIQLSRETIAMSKAFVTEEPTTDNDRPLSSSSSTYSSLHSRYERYMSLSTAATTFLERTPSFNKLKRGSLLQNKNQHIQQSQQKQLYVKQHNHSISSSSVGSIDFLKNYDFPTLMENEEQTDDLKPLASVSNINTTNPSSIFSKSELPSKKLQNTNKPISPKSNRTRSDSTSASLTTPELEKFLFCESNQEISVDDILRYYKSSDVMDNVSYL